MKAKAALLVFFLSAPAPAGDFGTVMKGRLSQCYVDVMHFFERFSFKDADVVVLNRLLGRYGYRANLSMYLGNQRIDGFMNRSFVLEKTFRFNSRPRPSNHMVYPVVRRDRTTGIKDIASGVMHSQEESSWIFIPSRELWVESAIAVEENIVYQDPVLITALMQKFGRVEVFHTHPLKVVQKIQKARNIPLSPFVLAALPSGADLSHLLGLAWNSDRTVPQTLGVIHPLGVTYYLPTRALLTADVGPPFIDIGDPSIQKKIAGSDVVAIQTILEIMSDQNRILTFTDTAGPLAFEMKYFSLADLPRVTQWLDEHVAYLTKDEETERVLLRGRDSR